MKFNNYFKLHDFIIVIKESIIIQRLSDKYFGISIDKTVLAEVFYRSQ